MGQENTTLDDIAAVVGLSATVKLAAWFGGLGNLYVPNTAAEGQVLVKLIGMPAAKRMTQEWGGEHLAVPRLSNYEDEMLRHLIGRMLENGFGSGEVARHMQMSQRRVQQICRELEQAGLIKIVVQVRQALDAAPDVDDPASETDDDQAVAASRNLQRAMGSLFRVSNPTLDTPNQAQAASKRRGGTSGAATA